jgi:hypothetical protein
MPVAELGAGCHDWCRDGLRSRDVGLAGSARVTVDGERFQGKDGSPVEIDENMLLDMPDFMPFLPHE